MTGLPHPVLTVPEVARHYRIGTAQVYRAVRRGELRAARFGTVLRILREDADHWFSERMVLADKDYLGIVVIRHQRQQRYRAVSRVPIVALSSTMGRRLHW